MKKFKNHTLQEYLDVLSKRQPVPGGGSVAAATAAMATGLLMMAGRFGLGRSNPKRIEERSVKVISELEEIRKRFLEIVDEDAQAYLAYSKIPKAQKAKKKQAQRKIAAVPKEVIRLCRKAVRLSEHLAKYGNPYLLSDIHIAVELLLASHRSAQILEQENA